MLRRDERQTTGDERRVQDFFSFFILCSSFLLVAFLTAACNSSGSLQIMGEQPRYDPYQASNFYANGMSARPVVSDTVTFMQPLTNTLLYQGTVNGALATTFPFAITDAVMERGQQRYNIYCAPCHGALGDGQGVVAQRGFCCPANFHTDTLRAAPVGHFFDVMTNGFGRMPSYGELIPARDRWAIIAYVRALQLSQHATLDDVPSDQKNKLGNTTP